MGKGLGVKWHGDESWVTCGWCVMGVIGLGDMQGMGEICDDGGGEDEEVDGRGWLRVM